MAKNYRIEGNRVISYSTHVATISGDSLIIHGWWSKTTSSHINEVARNYGLKKIEGPRDTEPKEQTSPLKSVAMVAALGEIFGKTDKEKNDWKKRMLNTIPGSDFPADWDTLSEEEKKRRLDGAIDILK